MIRHDIVNALANAVFDYLSEPEQIERFGRKPPNFNGHVRPHMSSFIKDEYLMGVTPEYFFNPDNVIQWMEKSNKEYGRSTMPMQYLLDGLKAVVESPERVETILEKLKAKKIEKNKNLKPDELRAKEIYELVDVWSHVANRFASRKGSIVEKVPLFRGKESFRIYLTNIFSQKITVSRVLDCLDSDRRQDTSNGSLAYLLMLACQKDREGKRIIVTPNGRPVRGLDFTQTLPIQSGPARG